MRYLTKISPTYKLNSYEFSWHPNVIKSGELFRKISWGAHKMDTTLTDIKKPYISENFIIFWADINENYISVKIIHFYYKSYHLIAFFLTYDVLPLIGSLGILSKTKCKKRAQVLMVGCRTNFDVNDLILPIHLL